MKSDVLWRVPHRSGVAGSCFSSLIHAASADSLEGRALLASILKELLVSLLQDLLVSILQDLLVLFVLSLVAGIILAASFRKQLVYSGPSTRIFLFGNPASLKQHKLSIGYWALVMIT